MTVVDEATPATADGSEPATRALGHEDLWSIPIPADPQISPDGRQVAYVVTTPDQRSDDYRSVIWTVPAQGDDPRPLTGGPRDRAPRWSPDGRRLAFLASRAEDQPAQIHVLSLDGGEAVALTDLPGGAGEPVWSPDGSRVAFAAPTDLEQADAHAPVVTSRLGYKVDGAGLIGGVRVHLFVVEVDAADASARQLTFGDCSVTSPVWSPDGARLAFLKLPRVRARSRDGRRRVCRARDGRHAGRAHAGAWNLPGGGLEPRR